MDTWPNLYYLKRDDRKPGTRGECDEREILLLAKWTGVLMTN
jgi:hypothetical protein